MSTTITNPDISNDLLRPLCDKASGHDTNPPEELLWSLFTKAAGYLTAQSALVPELPCDELEILSAQERAALLLGNLLGQVRNGGFRQWIGNGYGLRLRETRAVAAAIGTELSEMVVGMLDDLEEFIDLDAENRGAFGMYFRMTPEQKETYREGGEVLTDGQWLCGVLDHHFYRIDRQWQREINEWLAEGAPARLG